MKTNFKLAIQKTCKIKFHSHGVKYTEPPFDQTDQESKRDTELLTNIIKILFDLFILIISLKDKGIYSQFTLTHGP